MKVLVITGDKSFKPGHGRYDLQRSAVDELVTVYWGRGSFWPALPAEHFDVVTAQDPFWRGLFGWQAAKRKGATFNVQVHTDLSVYKGARHILAQVVLRRADSIRLMSEKVRQQVERMGVKAKITVLPVYVDVQRFRTVTPVSHEIKTILWIGRFEEEKDPAAALEMFTEVHKAIPIAKLTMLGTGSLQDSLRSLSKGMPVEFAGWKDPVPYLETADVVLCTSLHEGWGASIVEALAAGVPVVAPDVGIAKEAGANVVERADLAKEVLRVLQAGERGHLQLKLLTKEEWAQKWAKTLQ